MVPTRTPATGVMPMRSRQSAGWGTEHLPTRHRRPVLAWQVLGWHLVAWHVVCGWHRAEARWGALAGTWRSAQARHPALRYAQIIPVAFVLFGLDYAASFRAGAAVAGLRNAVVVNSVTMDIGGGFAHAMNNWLATHHVGAMAATWYYIVMQGALTGVLGALLIWRRVPSFPLHRNALIAVTALGLVAFWNYPVAPPRMLPGYHDVIASTLPTFAKVVEPNGSATYAALPSLHVAWAMWAAIAGATLVRRPALRALLWLYPAATIVDILATANHYLLDAITAIGLLALGYGLAIALDRARTRLADRRAVGAASAVPSPGAIRLADGASSPQAIRLADGASSPQAVRLADGSSSPQAIRLADGASFLRGIRLADGGSFLRGIRVGFWRSSPQASDRGNGRSSPRATQPHGAVLVCALPEADGQGRSGDGAGGR
jgi:PAP2 superfamily